MSDPRAHGRERFILGFATGAIVAAAVAVGIVALTGGFESSPSVSADAQGVIEQNYFKPVHGSLLQNASVDGMISALKKRYGDKFSHYFDPKELRQFDQSNSGQFSGVGLLVTGTKQGLQVSTVLPDSPAKSAGLRPDDVIVGVDGKSIAGVPEDVAVARIKGPPGTPVTLTVRSGGKGKPHDVHLKRASVKLPVARGHITHAGPTKVGYVHFATFSSGSHGELAQAIERLDSKGAKGLVLDLRGNPGGQLNESVLAASLFLKKGQRVVSTRSRTQGNKVYDAVGDQLPKMPIVVLIDHNTASAAEILASALAEHHVATTVGTRSFGKGTFQEVIRLDGGGALDLTVGRYFTANGTSLLGKGITPDLKVENKKGTKRDEQLQKALSVLAENISVANR
ncbi:MAG: S41 family peptidase [Rhodospirillaceae bacterium]